MSRAIKKQLFRVLESLKKMNGILERIGTEGSYEKNIPDLLIKCQETAITIGTRAESVIGKNSRCVHELEEYCECVFQLSQVIEKREMCKPILKNMNVQLEHVSGSLDQEISDKLEVVFLPYKSSMWDSLESIWQTAEEDTDAEVYVIPIPYYEKDSNGAMKKEYYEGTDFPDYVPITHYSQYDFEVRHPDIVFIHNPYDECNLVTSVHPFYYSRNLKNYSEKLVYVPYFVLDGRVVPEEFALLPAVVNADYVIVQNDTEKREYIRHFSESYPEFQIADKILPLGSPKFDKLHPLKGDKDVPQEWMNRISGKKVIFYNTSINGLLKGNDRYIKKLENVFQLFKSRPDIVLIWRPHPLMESTLLSLRPELYEEYMTLKNFFLKENIGIYDDSADMYTAIRLSDAYYGDGSSVVHVYQATGKPVMLQNIDILVDKNEGGNRRE